MEMEKKVSRSQPQPQDVIDLVEVFHLLLHKWKLLFVAILAGSVLGGAYCTFLLETTYAMFHRKSAFVQTVVQKWNIWAIPLSVKNCELLRLR